MQFRLLLLISLAVAFPTQLFGEHNSATQLKWQELTPIPDTLGLAGPFVGVHNDALIVAGGANFPTPVWESDKVWHDQIYVWTEAEQRWLKAATLQQPSAYGCSVSTPHGVVCLGGNDSHSTFSDCFLLQWDSQKQSIVSRELPPLPQPCAYGAATRIGDVIYVAGGQTMNSLDSATNNFWALDLSQMETAEFRWRELPDIPGPGRAFNLTARQHNGFEDCIYVISGRTADPNSPGGVRFLQDVWAYVPSTRNWKRCSDVPRCVMAGTAIDSGQSHLFVFGGDDGRNFFRADELKEDHPGFPREALAYHTITDRWSSAGPTPIAQVTTTAVRWQNRIVIPTGEVRPRVRTPQVWSVVTEQTASSFGLTNSLVLCCYLLAMVGVGIYFTWYVKDTDDFFRGGKSIPWWAAGCSIFATMLSSLTFTGIPSKAFAQDWTYAVGNLMIPVVAILAVFVALPFFRRIDATSAYEYLEKRFNRSVRLFGSACFCLFHVFRMAVVMSLTALALAVATPLSPAQSILLMGVLSILYCTLGGIEAVIWTDTIQTVVLLGGAVLALGLLIAGVDGGLTGFFTAAGEAGKFNAIHLHWDVTSQHIAIWAVIIGAIGQNVSSYTADQAVVQRYMTTATEKLAARAIWTNAVLTIPATLLFFGIGTALFAFYQSHPERLASTIATDQVFPLFIAREMPVGIAGLIVAAIFAAAQSTVSTSMNSIATAIVTDFIRPFDLCHSETSYFRLARFCTFAVGVLGTLLGLIFINPEIKSLFDTFIVVIGLFMGVLGGLFVLGAATTRATGPGALIGALYGAGVMFYLWYATDVNGYLFTTCGISTCLVIGYLASLLTGTTSRNLDGLTIHTLQPKTHSPVQSPETVGQVTT